LGSYNNLLVYQEAFDLAMEIFHLSKGFPNVEKYSLTDQIRRSSRSVCQCIAESYRKRRYQLHFISKLTDADAESSETRVWLDFAFECGYLVKEKYLDCCRKNEIIGKRIGHMIQNPKLFIDKSLSRF
jgi:four helix bundle protein